MDQQLTELAGNLILEDGRILLLYRRDEGHWEVPGGKVEQHESPTEAAKREAEEEIGVEVELEKPFYSREFEHSGQLFLWHCYLAGISGGKPEIQEERFGRFRWFEPGELEEVQLAPNLEMILPALRKI